MRTEPLLLGVRVAGGPVGDSEELADVVRRFGRELLALDVEAVRTPTEGDVPTGSKGLELDGDVRELTGVSRKEQRRLTDEWPQRHGSGP